MEIVKGNIQFGVNNEVLDLVEGSIIALEGHVFHDLKANEDSIVRLTLSTNDDSNRVKKVVD